MPNQIYHDTVTGNLLFQGTSGTPAILAEADGSVTLIPLSVNYAVVTGIHEVGTNTFEALGTLTFNPSVLFDGNSKITRTLSFRAILEVTSGVTAEIRLFNLTSGAAVTNSTLTSTATSPTVVSGSLTIGASPNVPNSAQTYEVQLRISAPTDPIVSDRAICKSAEIVVNWT